MDLKQIASIPQIQPETVELKTLWDTVVKIPSPVPITSQKSNKHFMVKFQQSFIGFVRNHSDAIRRTVIFLCLLSYLIYLAFAIRHSLELAKPLIIITLVVFVIIIYVFVRDNLGSYLYMTLCMPTSQWIDKHWHWLKW